MNKTTPHTAPRTGASRTGISRTDTSRTGISRRGFLQTSAVASGGLMIGVTLPGTVFEAQAAGLLHTPNAWVHIADDNTITLISARSEMGQGVYTSMPMLIAEELNVDIQKVKVAQAPPGKVYGNALIFGLQLTGGVHLSPRRLGKASHRGGAGARDADLGRR